jgi:3-dehydroquinate synthase
MDERRQGTRFSSDAEGAGARGTAVNPTDERIVHFDTSPGYDVHVAPGLLSSCGAILSDTLGRCMMVVVSDDTVAGLYLPAVHASLEDAGFDVIDYVFPHGERNKGLDTLAGLLEFLATHRVSRSDCIVALGGGVVGDLAGFAAAVYLRGIRFVQVPTTLLAAVDASIGGKTGVDLSAGKNMAGAFHQPSAVICDTDTFDTLPPELVSEGAAEVLKYGVLRDPDLFDRLPHVMHADRVDVVARCVEHKRHYVEPDEQDHGARRFLNLGHTVGHAIELCSGYSLYHGEAVAMGMACVARSCERAGEARPGTSERIETTCMALSLPTRSPYDAAELFAAAASDKKREGDEITIVGIRDIGQCFLRTMPFAGLEDFLVRGLGE